MRAALKKQNLRKERTKNTKVSTRLEVQEQNVQLPGDLSPRKILEDIVRYTARAFYEEEHAILLEALIERVEATDSILAETISLQKKQVNLRLSELKSDLLIGNEKFSKKKESHHKFGTNETVWFIDYKNFVDVVKFRLSKMQKLAEERETGDVQYVCTSCSYRYSSYEIPAELVCTACKTGEVREDEAFASQAQAERQLVMQLQKQLEPLIRLIKYTSDMVIPASRTKYATEARTKEQHRQEEDARIRLIQIQDQLGKHNVQNNLPSRTFLGATPNLVVEVATEEQNNIMAPPKKVEKPAQAAPAAATPSKSDSNVSVQIVSGGEQVEEKTNDLIWLKRNKTDYLSKLNLPSSSSSTFAQKAASMQAAPLVSPITPSPAPINEEDMRDYFIDTSHQQSEQTDDASMYEEAQPQVAVDVDKIVYVNGEPKKLSEVTEEDQLLMTQEEYLAFFNAQNS